MCWWCSSIDLSAQFMEYRTAFCLRGCDIDHDHTEEIPVYRLKCKSCGNKWIDGSGDRRPPS